MHNSLTGGGEEIVTEKSEIDKNLDQLKLRLTPNVHENDIGAGDPPKHRIRCHPLKKIGLTEPNCHKLPRGYESSKIFRKATPQAVVKRPVDDFLVPPDRKNTNRNTAQLSIIADRGKFPFESTPSGNLKVKSEQVVFESQRLSVLVTDPNTKINVYSEVSSNPSTVTMKKVSYGGDALPKNSAMEAILNQAGIAGLGSLLGDTPQRSTPKIISEYQSKETSEILDPELSLCRLGYSGSDPIEWSKVTLPDKRDLYVELSMRINDRKNADCKVHIADEEFSCHLIVLQCYSELFDGYVAIKKVEIPPEKCSASSFAFIYEWMVSDEQLFKYLSRDNALEIFNSAKYLKIKDLTEQCWAFIDNNEAFYEDTAFLLYVEAKEKRVEEVLQLMVPRIQDFFLILVSSQDWLELNVEDVKSLLSSNYIRINCEMEVFMSAVRWLKYDWTNRDRYKFEVLNCVRFGNIAPWQLVDIKRNPENPEFMEVAQDPAVCKLVDDGLAFVIIKYWYGNENADFTHWNSILGLREPASRNWSGLDKTYFTYREFLIYLDQYRRAQLIEKSKPRLIGDRKIGGPSGALATLNTCDDNLPPSMDDFLARKKVEECVEHKNALKIFTPSRESVALTNLNRLSSSMLGPKDTNYLLTTSLFLPNHETILVLGGVDPYSIYGSEGNTGNVIYRYLPNSNEWEYVGDLPEPRHHHSIGFLKGRIYLVGGSDPRDDGLRGKSFVVNTVWSFEPIRRRWFSEQSLRVHRRNFGLVVCHRRMYAIGGYDRQMETLNSVERFDPKKGVWKFMAAMKYARAGIACAKYRDYIWAAGGTTDARNEQILDVVECYDVKNDQWSSITRLRKPHSFSSLFAMSDRLYLIGGASYQLKKDEYSCCGSSCEMDLWDSLLASWRHMSNLAVPRHGHKVAYVGTQIFIIGGITTTYMKSLSNIECFCTKRERWVRGITPLPTPLSGHAAVTLPPGKLMSKTKSKAEKLKPTLK